LRKNKISTICEEKLSEITKTIFIYEEVKVIFAMLVYRCNFFVTNNLMINILFINRLKRLSKVDRVFR